MTHQTTVPPWSLGDRLRKSAKHAGKKLPDLIAVMEVSKSTIERWTSDSPEAKPMSRGQIRDWAEMCDVPVAWLIDGTGTLNEPAPAREIPSPLGPDAFAINGTVAQAIEEQQSHPVRHVTRNRHQGDVR